MPQTAEVKDVATSVRTDTGTTIVRYQQTDVVMFDIIGVDLNSGGRRTATTKLRMNQASNQYGLGYTVFQKDYEWFVTLPNGTTVEFHDGMTFPR